MLNGEEVIPRRLVNGIVQQERRRLYDKYMKYVRGTAPRAEPSLQQMFSVKDGDTAPRVVGNREANESVALAASSAEAPRDTVPKTKEAPGAGIATTATRQLAPPAQKGNTPAPVHNRLPGPLNANGSNLDRLTGNTSAIVDTFSHTDEHTGLSGNGNVKTAAHTSSQPSHPAIRTPAALLPSSSNLWSDEQMTEMAWMLDTLAKKFPGRTPKQVEDMVRTMINVRHPPKPRSQGALNGSESKASFDDTQVLQANSLSQYLARQLGTSGIAKTPAQPTSITINLPDDLARYGNADSLAVNVPVRSAPGQNVTVSLNFRAAQQPMPRQQPPRPNHIPPQNTMPPAPRSNAQPPRPPITRSGKQPSVPTGKSPPTHQATSLHASEPPKSPPPGYYDSSNTKLKKRGYNVYEDSQGRLPGGWERSEDRLGRTYYINHCGLETSWIRPKARQPSSDFDPDSHSDSDDELSALDDALNDDDGY